MAGDSALQETPDVAAPDVAAPDVAAPDVAAPDVAAPDVAAPLSKEDRSVSPHRRLTSKQRVRWRAAAGRLERPLLLALVADARMRDGKLKDWVASQENSLIGDDWHMEAVVDWVSLLRTSLLHDLVNRYSRLLERDSARNRDIHRAARAFHEEFMLALGLDEEGYPSQLCS